MSESAVLAATAAETLSEKIRNRTARAGVVGLGYVGLPLAVELADAGFAVTGIDLSPDKVNMIQAGHSYVKDVPTPDLARCVKQGKIQASVDFSQLAAVDTVNICVPTPLRKTKDPDLTYVVQAAKAVAAHLHPGMLIILESTTYPGTTDELLLPMFERDSLRAGRDFWLCFSPERVDPGNQIYQTRNIPKVVGGVTPECTEMGALLYRQALQTVVPVSSARVAEMVKLLENTFRMINIGLVNEIALMCDRMGIDVWEIIDAAATKPFGFMPFYPGPGLGGHCIPIDPFYLSWKSRQAGFEPRFIELAGYINAQMPRFAVEKVQAALNERSMPLKGSKIHILGVAYKRDIDDIRESPALDVIHLLTKAGAKVTYSDPYIRNVHEDGIELRSIPVEEGIAAADCVMIITDHALFDYNAIVKGARLVVDTRNATKNNRAAHVIRL